MFTKGIPMKRCGWQLIRARIMLVMAVVSINQVRADIALVDTAGEAGLSMAIAQTGPTAVTISNFTVSAMANVLVVLVEDKGASAVNSEPATLTWGSQTLLKAVAQDNPNRHIGRQNEHEEKNLHQAHAAIIADCAFVRRQAEPLAGPVEQLASP